jgi:EF-P beta-lysylation protein EpmB
MHIVATPSQIVVTGSTHDSANSWQQSVRRAIRDPVLLCQHLQLPAEYREAAERSARQFGVFVPWEYLGRIRAGDLCDPLLRQVLPLSEEEDESVEGFSTDPVGDGAALAAPGLLHKYPSRVLLVVSGACAVHCRYCFRRHFPYDQMPHGLDDWQPALRQIADDTTIDEVILSGGDPLMLVDDRLSELTEQIAQIKHVQRLRIHTRLPIMIPSRVTASLLSWLSATRLTSFVVVHVNHAAEIDFSVAAALTRLVDAGIVVLNQSVLLRGVNDSATALVDLSRRLLHLRVLPYYLHQLDRTSGTAHFEVPVDIGRAILREMRTQLPGYAVPRFVQEISGRMNKHVLA